MQCQCCTNAVNAVPMQYQCTNAVPMQYHCSQCSANAAPMQYQCSQCSANAVPNAVPMKSMQDQCSADAGPMQYCNSAVFAAGFAACVFLQFFNASTVLRVCFETNPTIQYAHTHTHTHASSRELNSGFALIKPAQLPAFQPSLWFSSSAAGISALLLCTGIPALQPVFRLCDRSSGFATGKCAVQRQC